MEEEKLFLEIPQWLKDAMIAAAKSVGKAAAIAVCKKHIAKESTCKTAVSIIMAALGL